MTRTFELHFVRLYLLEISSASLSWYLLPDAGIPVSGMDLPVFRAIILPMRCLTVLVLAVCLDACSGCSDTRLAGHADAGADVYFDSLHDPDIHEFLDHQEITWSRTYGTGLEDSGLSVVGSSDGGYVVAGTIRDEEAWEQDAWLLRLDAMGEPLWQRTYAWDARERWNVVVETADGGLALAGGAAVDRTTGRAGIAARLDAGGVPLWAVGFVPSPASGPEILVERITDVVPLDSGGIAVAGQASGNIVVARLDPSGGLVQMRLLSGTGTDSWNAPSLARTADGGLAVGARGGVDNPSEHSYVLAKLDAGGDLEWAKTYAGALASEPPAGLATVLCSTSGSYFVASDYTLGSGYRGILGLALDASGRPSWARVYTSDSWDLCAGLSVAPSHPGGWTIAGYWRRADAWLLRIGEDGSVDWSLRYHESGVTPYVRDEMRAVDQAPDGGIVAAGSTEGFGAVAGDIWVLKTDAAGRIRGDCPAGIGSDADVLAMDLDIPYADIDLDSTDPFFVTVPVALATTPIDAVLSTQCSG